MKTLIIKVRDKNEVHNLEQFGTILFISPILNTIGFKTKEENIELVKADTNVISFEEESTGELMFA